MLGYLSKSRRSIIIIIIVKRAGRAGLRRAVHAAGAAAIADANR